MEYKKDFINRMSPEEYSTWQTGSVDERINLTTKYLQQGEIIEVDSLGQNLSSIRLEEGLEKAKEVLPRGFKAILYPKSQREETHRRLLVSRR